MRDSWRIVGRATKEDLHEAHAHRLRRRACGLRAGARRLRRRRRGAAQTRPTRRRRPRRRPRTARTLTASVGPGFEISLTEADGAEVTTLAAGTYTIEVDDQSGHPQLPPHGPGRRRDDRRSRDRDGDLGRHSRGGLVLLRQCDPHASQMNGDFEVYGLEATSTFRSRRSGRAPRSSVPVRGRPRARGGAARRRRSRRRGSRARADTSRRARARSARPPSRRSSITGSLQCHGSSRNSDPSVPIASSSSRSGRHVPQSKSAWTSPGKRIAPVNTQSVPGRADVGLAVHGLGLTREQARAADAVAADVHEAPALDVGAQADVLGVVERVAERRADDAQLADRAVANELDETRRLRVVPVHERLGQQAPAPLGSVEGLPRRPRSAC